MANLSIYSHLLKAPEPSKTMPEYLKDGMSMRQLAMQNQAGEQKLADEDRNRKMGAQIEAMEYLAGLPDEQTRAKEFMRVQDDLIRQGITPREQALPEYVGDQAFNNMFGRIKQSPQYMERQKQSAEIDKLRADADHHRALAKRGVARDPMEFFVAKERYKEEQDARQKEKDLQTPYGTANTADDAKKLKDAGELKSNFDRKLSEMIALREEFGGEAMDRDAVGRGKQLSNDLLLLYKDLSKLGVMSLSDEKILRSIIPSDPLEYRSPVAALQGQDPTMHRMKKFKEDSEADFQTRLATRLRGGQMPAQTMPGQAPSSGGFNDGVNSAVANEPPKHGTEQDGYVFMGGDPANPKSWKKAR
jgi:hypothetical protein